MVAADQARPHWHRVTEMRRRQFPNALPAMETAIEDGLAFFHVPQEHWRKIWSTNPLERLNNEIKRPSNVVGIFSNDDTHGLRPTPSTSAGCAANDWSSRRNGSWSANGSSSRPSWTRSQSPRNHRNSSTAHQQSQRRKCWVQRPLTLFLIHMRHLDHGLANSAIWIHTEG